MVDWACHVSWENAKLHFSKWNATGSTKGLPHQQMGSIKIQFFHDSFLLLVFFLAVQRGWNALNIEKWTELSMQQNPELN